MTDYSTAAHYALPPADIDEAAFLDGTWTCKAPECDQPPDARVHSGLSQPGYTGGVYEVDIKDGQFWDVD